MAKQKDALGGDGIPDTTVSAKEVFGLDIDMEIPAFSKPSEHVPTIDPTYRFNPETTLAIWRVLRTTGAVWCRGITVRENRPISSRWLLD